MSTAEVAQPGRQAGTLQGAQPGARRTFALAWLILRREWRLTQVLFASELRELLVSRALWAMILISAPLVGFSFIQAVRRYGETSSNALKLPQLAANLSPLDGIIVPTLGAIYLLNTFLLPFVAIRVVGNGKQTGALKLLLQLPVGRIRLIGIKLGVLGVGWFMALVPVLIAFLIWNFVLGGHIGVPELASALLGHLLYAFVIAGVAFLAGAITDSAATAAIVALSFTLGSWILEFAATTSTGLVRAVAAFSLTPALRGLERGLVGSPTALTLLVLGFGFLALTVVWLPPGTSRRRKLVQSGAVVGLAAQMLLLAIQLPLFTDVSEDRRNSFNPADERALRSMTKELKISVNLASNDSRLADLDRNVLSRLPRVMQRVNITYPETSTTGLFGGTTGAGYGQVTYTYGGKQGTSRATTARELLPLIESLDGLNVTPDKVGSYPGYPLVTSAEGSALIFYVILPALAVGGWWFFQRAPQIPESLGGVRKIRWPWLQPYLPGIRRVALVAGVGLLAIQVIPYGRGHVNVTVSPADPTVAATCQRVFPPGTESAMQLGDFKSRIGSAVGSINTVLGGFANNDSSAYNPAYGQFAQAYRGFALELAELYPGRCPRLNADAIAADQALTSSTPSNAAAPLYGLAVGLSHLSQELDTRIRQEGPEQFVGLETPESDDVQVTGTPIWDSERTQLLTTRACASCHSNQPNLPWYTNIAPVSWLVQQQVDRGRAVLNFSEWDAPQQDGAARAAASVQAGNMPPAWANGLTGQQPLSDDERAELVRGLRATLNGVR